MSRSLVLYLDAVSADALGGTLEPKSDIGLDLPSGTKNSTCTWQKEKEGMSADTDQREWAGRYHGFVGGDVRRVDAVEAAALQLNDVAFVQQTHGRLTQSGGLHTTQRVSGLRQQNTHAAECSVCCWLTSNLVTLFTNCLWSCPFMSRRSVIR